MSDIVIIWKTKFIGLSILHFEMPIKGIKLLKQINQIYNDFSLWLVMSQF